MFEQYKQAISEQRLEGYRNGCDDLNTLARCMWNAALCEAFYPSLLHLEVGLRNSLNKAGTSAFRDPLWFKRPFLCDRCQEDVSIAENELNKEGKDCTNPGRIIAELKFGFWTRLFSRQYEAILWNNGIFISTAFPDAHKRVRVRKTLAARFDRIRRFRNRIFHYENILNYNFPQHHADIMETMNWFSPSLSRINTAIDRFAIVSSTDYYNDLREKLKIQMPAAVVAAAPSPA